MAELNSIVEKSLKKYLGVSINKLNKFLIHGLENRLTSSFDPTQTFEEAKKSFQRAYFDELLTLNHGNISKSASAANLNRRQIHRICNELGIEVDKIRDEMKKPIYYMTQSVQDIVEQNLDRFRDELMPNVLVNAYMNLPEISKTIADTLEIASYSDAVEVFEKQYFESVLENTGYHIEKAAEVAGLSSRHTLRKARKHAII